MKDKVGSSSIKAIGRRMDQLIIDGLDALLHLQLFKNCCDFWIGCASNLNVGKLIAAKKALDANNVPFDDRHIIVHANNLSGLLGDERAISGDFATVKALVAGEINTFLGFRFYVLGDRDEGGLPLSTNDRTVFAFHNHQSVWQLIWGKN